MNLTCSADVIVSHIIMIGIATRKFECILSGVGKYHHLGPVFLVVVSLDQETEWSWSGRGTSSGTNFFMNGPIVCKLCVGRNKETDKDSSYWYFVHC